MISLRCGHILCPADFRRLGGTIQDDFQEESDDEDEEPPEDTIDFRRQLLQYLLDDLQIEENQLPDARDFLVAALPTEDPPRQQDVARQQQGGSNRVDDDDDDDDVVLPSRNHRTNRFAVDDDGMPDLESDDSDDDDEMPALLAAPPAPDSSSEDSDGGNNRQPNRSRQARANDNQNRFASSRAASAAAAARPNRVDLFNSTICIAALRRARTTGLRFYTVNQVDGFQQINMFHPSSMVVPTPNGTAIFAKAKGEIVVLDKAFEEKLKYENIPRTNHLVNDGDDSFWCLVVATEHLDLLRTCPSYVCKSIAFLPKESRLVGGGNGYVWVVVKKDGFGMKPGIWWVSPSKKKHVHKELLGGSAKVIPDGKGNLWLMEEPLENLWAEFNRVRMFRVTRNGSTKIGGDVSASNHRKENNLITCKKGGIYFHCKDKERWCLFHFTPQGDLNFVAECPKDASIASDRNSNLWIMVKRRGSKYVRMLNPKGELVYECSEPLDLRCELVGSQG